MKKKTALLIAFMMSLSAVSVHADDLEVQMIGGDDIAIEAVNLNDLQLEQTYEIDGYAKVSPVSFEYIDYFPQYGKNAAGDNTVSDTSNPEDKVKYQYSNYYNNIFWMHSGENADFAWFLVDITNLQKEPYSFMQEAQVKVVYDEDYEFAGWLRQFNYDYDTKRQTGEDYGTFIRAAIESVDEEAIDMMYTGHYVFGCTLPNAVVTGEEPLRMEISLGDNELTYHIRK